MVLDYASLLARDHFPPGEVWLVGAGPGDPGLLTLRAAQALSQADLILHDSLSGGAVLRHARPDAEIIAVGKRKGAAPVPQPHINQRLVEGARAGQRVLRLKGGDPFIFGRGAEEARACQAAGIPWRVIPGVSAGLAAPAVAGIALTQRGMAQAVTFITAHDEAGGLPVLDWAALPGTIAAFMALSRLNELAVLLIAAGRPAATPVAIIAGATLAGQVTLRSTLGACSLVARRAALQAPALVVIGDVAAVDLTTHAPAAAARRHA